MIPAAVLALLASLAVHPVLGNTSLHFEGCFETSYVEKHSSYYRINHPPLTWEAGLATCNNRLTTYLGLRADDSSSAFYHVYCGNGLPDVSPKVNSSKCLPCQDRMGHTCGGLDTMSVYKIRDNTPLAALLATDRGVEILEDNTTTLRVPYVDTSGYKHVDYLYTDDAIFFVYNQSLLRSDFNYNVMKYTYTQNLLEEDSTLRSLAVDFTRREVYWGYWASDLIFKTVLETMTNFQISDRANYPYHYSLDAYSRLMFFVEYDYPSIFLYNISSGTISKFNVSHQIEHIYTLAIDTHQQLLYSFINFKGDPNCHLVRWDYNVSGMVVLYSNVSSEPRAFDVFNNSALWVELESNKYTVYRCKLTPRCLPRNLAAVYQTNWQIYDLKIYHPERQTAGVRRLCANMRCSHVCRALSPFTARCFCPAAHNLAADNTTCIKDDRVTSQEPPSQTSYTVTKQHLLSTEVYITESTTKDYPLSSPTIYWTQDHMKHEITKPIGPTTRNDVEETYKSCLHALDIVHTILLLIIIIGIIILIIIRYKKTPQSVMSDLTGQELQHCSNAIYDVINDTEQCN